MYSITNMLRRRTTITIITWMIVMARCWAQPLRFDEGDASNNTADIIRVTKLYLVNTNTGMDIMELTNETSYNLHEVGRSLTIRAETNDKNGCGWVAFILDQGVLEHTDLNEPFTLAGNDTDGLFYPSSTLTQLGQHTIKVAPSFDGNLLEVPPEFQEVPILEHRSPRIKSCWSIEKYSGQSTASNTTAINTGEFSATSIETATANTKFASIPDRVPSITSLIQDPVGSLSSLLGSGNRRLRAKTVPRDLSVSIPSPSVGDSANDDGSIYITFYAIARSKTMAPTPAPLPSYDVSGYQATTMGSIQGNFKLWHKLTIGFVGPTGSELGSSERGPYGPLDTFKDFRLDVTFTHQSTGQTIIVPGYFALDGDAANSIGKIPEGSVWLAHFVPNQPGEWKWSGTFVRGENCAPNGGGESAKYFDGSEGIFFVDITDPTEAMESNDLRTKGKLEYVGMHHLQFAGTEEYFLKMGPDSPENILDYVDFDDTPNKSNLKKLYSAHEGDYVPGNPTWSKGNGTAIIGAINYLASKGMNILSVTVLNTNGPDGNVSPFSDPTNAKFSYDVSKLAQWGVVFDWAERQGMALRLKLQDRDSDDLLDKGATDVERKTFYREMVARFGHHLGMIWDLGEDITNVSEIQARSEFLRNIDPYSSPIMVQTEVKAQDSVYKSLLGLSTVECISVNSHHLYDVGSKTLSWIEASAEAGRPLVVSNDMHGHGIVTDAKDPDHIDALYLASWVNLMSGGSGSQFDFGSSGEETDLTCQDFRSRDKLFTEAGLALDFFFRNDIPFYDMVPVSNDGFISMISATAKIVVVYKLPGTVTLLVDLPGTATYSLVWYNPRTGESTDSSLVLKGGSDINIGAPPSNEDYAWVSLMQCTANCEQ